MREVLYYNGTILTMEGQSAEAVLTKDGIICAVGSREDVLMHKSQETELFDLDGKTMLPAFLDAHSHLTALAQTMSACALDMAHSLQELVECLQNFSQRAALSGGEWLIGFGYDQNALSEHRHPDKRLLDAAFPDRPVLISHASGHMGVANSAALHLMEITAETPDPAGGKIGRLPDSREPNGYLEETAFTAGSAKVPQPTMEQLLRQLQMAEEIYLQNGIVTIQDGLTRDREWALLRQAAVEGRLRADVVAYPELPGSAAIAAENPEYCRHYQNHLKIGGYKMFLDGSPQGRTAWMSVPYCGDSDYCGYPIHSDEEVLAFVERAVADKMQLLTHCNGDAAAQQLITACEHANVAESGIRPVMIHAQLVRRDQLPRMAALSMIASFFVSHTYHWSPVHRINFGGRAERISPTASAMAEQVCFTFHQDTPVLPPNVLELVWCAVNRISKDGSVVGPEERISVLEALDAVTKNAAYQYFEEDCKGSIAPGKYADFVILDCNPLLVDPMELRNLQVCMTIRRDEVLYQRDAGGQDDAVFI